MSLPLQRNFKVPSNGPKSFYERYFGLGEGSGLFICFFKFWKKHCYWQFQTAENRADLQKRTSYANILASFRSLVFRDTWGHSESQACLKSFQNLFSMLSHRALLFRRQSCKPEELSWCNPEAELVWRQDTAHQMPHRKCPEGHKGRELVSQVMCTRLCDIRCSTETSHKKGQDSH